MLTNLCQKQKANKKQSKCFLFIIFNLLPAVLTYNLMISFRFVQGADSGTTRGGLDELSPLSLSPLGHPNQRWRQIKYE